MNKTHIKKNEYGDWQTNLPLALSICRYLKRQGVNPQVIIEPTCGIGNFVLAAIEVFENIKEIYAIEINSEYTQVLCERLSHKKYTAKVHVINDSIFNVDLLQIKKRIKGKDILVLGNPPWVTNSKLGEYESGNIPTKSNFKQNKGLDAITGKGNFDIAEFITYQMIEIMEDESGTLAFLLKNSVVKNLVLEQKKCRHAINGIHQYNIDTQKEFNVSVAGSLLTLRTDKKACRQCKIFDFYTKEYLKTFGWVDFSFVSDCQKYEETKIVDGISPIKWWSGLKHDCTKVMELTKVGNHYMNNLGENVEIEDGLVYPLLKSSDIKGEEIFRCRKYVIVTQHHTSDNTSYIKERFPLTFSYLNEHMKYFKNRKSTIYKNRPDFCIFGIGDYSFKKYKIVISGLYKQTEFSIVGEIDGKETMLDDTAYLLGFDDKFLAVTTLKLFNSNLVQEFIRSVFFEDSKRPINKDLLMRIDLIKALHLLGSKRLGLSEDEYYEYKNKICPQPELNLVW